MIYKKSIKVNKIIRQVWDYDISGGLQIAYDKGVKIQTVKGDARRADQIK